MYGPRGEMCEGRAPQPWRAANRIVRYSMENGISMEEMVNE